MTIVRLAWVLWSQLCGIGVIVMGLSYVTVMLFRTNTPVTIHTFIELTTKTVKPSGDVAYKFLANRLRNCKGYIAETFTAQDTSPSSKDYNVTLSRWRPVTNPEVGQYKRDYSTGTPPSIKLGRVKYRSELVSQCPDGEVRDLIAEFEYEVAP